MAETASATPELLLPEKPADLVESGSAETSAEAGDPVAFGPLASLLFVCARSGAMKIAMYAHAHSTSRGAGARRFVASRRQSRSNAYLPVIEAEVGKGAPARAIDEKSFSEPVVST